MSSMFHVSSVRNRDSIEAHGLDVTHMGAARGIAGSGRPEADGIFLSASEFEAEWFVQMNNTGGPVDVWQVNDIDADRLVGNGTGYFYLPGCVPARQLTLLHRDLAGGDLFRS